MRKPSAWLSAFYSGAYVLLGGCGNPPAQAPHSSPVVQLDTLPPLYTPDPLLLAEERRKAFIAYAQPRVGWIRVRAQYAYRRFTSEGTAWRLQNAATWVTCRHLFPSDKPQTLEIEIWDSTGTCHAFSRYWTDTLVDVAFIADTGQIGFSLAKKPAQVGDWCFTMGAPLGLFPSFQEGYVVAPYRPINHKSHLQLALWATVGSSGSPVLSRKGELIGMITDIASLSGGYEGVTFALSAHEIEEAYHRYITFAAYDTTRAD